MAGLSCPGLGSDLRDGVAWQCELYAEAWKSLATEEVHSVYGAHEPSATEKDDFLLASGTCIFDVTFAAAPGSCTKVLGRFPAAGDGVGGKFRHRPRGEQPAGAVISTTHPDVDCLAQPSFVSLDTDTDRRQGSLVSWKSTVHCVLTWKHNGYRSSARLRLSTCSVPRASRALTPPGCSTWSVARSALPWSAAISTTIALESPGICRPFSGTETTGCRLGSTDAAVLSPSR